MGALGNRLRDLRTKGGMTVYALAEAIGKTPGYVSRFEVRDEIPSPELLCRLAEIYKVDAEELLNLAKQDKVTQTQRQIGEQHAAALALFRKGKRK